MPTTKKPKPTITQPRQRICVPTVRRRLEDALPPELAERLRTAIDEHRSMWDMVDCVSAMCSRASNDEPDLLIGTFEGLRIIAMRMAADLQNLLDELPRIDASKADAR